MKIRLNPHTLQRAFVLLLFSLVAGISSVFAQEYTYLQFSGNGRTVLLAKDGALTVVSTTEDAPAGDGYQWTLETVLGDNVRLKNKEGMYVTSNLTLTNSQDQAATFTKTENTYSSTTYGSNTKRYDLVYGGKALGVKNGQLFWTVEDSRYGCIRLANNVKGAKVTPLVCSEGGKAYWYYMELLWNGSECVKDAGAGKNLEKDSTPSAKNLRAYMWSVYEANDKGDVYFKSADGNYFYRNGNYQCSASTKPGNSVYTICDVSDQSNDNVFVLCNSGTSYYVLPYNNSNKVGWASSFNMIEAMRFIPSTGPHIYQFSANAATAIYDNGTSVTMQPVGSEVAGYQWTLEQVGGAYVLKSGRDNYLKRVGDALTVTTNRDEALKVFLSGSAYDDRHYVLTLADDASKAVGVKDGQLAIVEANSFYSVVRILDSTDEVKGAVAPKISDISNVYYYKLQFKANPKGDARLTLTSTGYDNPVTRKEFEPTSASQNWKLEPARHANSKPGDFYLVNQMGEYLIYKDGRFNFETLDVNETTVFRLKQTDEQPEYWTIDMALSGDDNHRLGLQAGMTPDTLKACNSTSKFNALSFKESKRGSDYDYLQFSGSGRVVLYDDGQNVKAVATTTGQLEGNGYQWTFDPIMDSAGKVNGYNLKNKAGRFLRYNAADESFTSVTDRSKASVFDADQNTYYVVPAHVQGGTCNIAGGLRYNAVLRGVSGTYNTLGVKNGKLQLVKKNSRYAVVRLAENIEGGLVNPYVSTSANPHYYALNFFQNGSEYLQDNTPGNKLLKSPVAPFPLRRYCWILEEANDDGDVYIKSTAGNYISYNPATDGYQHKVKPTLNDYSLYKICDVADQPDASLEGLWSLYNCKNHYFVRPFPSENSVGRAEEVGKNTSMTFVDVAANTTSYHFVFPAMGQRALIMDYDEAKNPRVKARDILASDKDARLYQWVVEGQHIRNRAGFYLTYDKKNKQFGVSNQKADAYTFVYNVNNYENNNSVRYDLCSTDDQQALSIGEEGFLCWAARGTRNSVVDLRPYIIAPELPIPSLGGADYHLYCIRTAGGDRYAYHMEDATNTISLKPYEEKNLCQLWVLIRDGEGKGDGYLQSAYNRYFLKYDTVSNTFVAVADKKDATRLRLVETSGNYVHWQIELPDVNGNRNLISHSYSGGGNPKTVSLSLQEPYNVNNGNNGNNFVEIFPVDITPDFYEEAGGTFRNINLDELTPKLELTADGTVLKAKASASEDDANNSWKNIGTKDDFVLRNGHGQYIGADAGGNVFLTTDKAQATHFYLWLNHGDEDGTVSWCFAQLNADGSEPEGKPEKCLGVSDVANGTVAMLPFSTYETDRLHTLCFTFGRLTCPELSDAAEGKYYYNFICFDKAGNKYISDGNDTSKLVFAENDKKLVNDQMWALVGQSKDDVVLMSKDKYYVYLDGERFYVTHDPEKAVHFSVKYISSKQRYALTIVGGVNTEGKIGHSMNLSGADANRNTIIPWNSDIQTDPNICLNFTPIPVPEDYSDYEVLPKRSWFVKQAHEATADPMNGFIQRDESGWTKNPYTGKMMQKTSTYTVTHYLKAESTRKLYVPTCMVGSANTRSRAFQRWYNYKTDEAVSDSVLNLDLSSSRRYRNGIVVGEQLNLNGQNYGNYVDHYVTFQMPEVIPDDWEYILGGDLTTYSDFVDYFGDNGNPLYNGNVTSDIILPSKQNIVEPTITGRNLYVIRNARAIANELLQCKEEGNSNDKWYEEHTIAFPKKKVTLNYSSVALNMQKQDYWFYNNGSPSEDNLQNAVNNGAIEVEVEDSLHSGITFAKFLSSGAGGAATDRAIAFNYPDDDNGKGRGEAKAGSCTLKVYGRASNGTRYQIAKFNLTFEDNFEPIIYSEIIGKKDDGTFKSERSPEALLKTTGDPVATITFDPDQFDAFVSPPVGTYTGFTNSGKGDNANQKYALTYRYPFNYDNTSYCFAPIGGDFNSTNGRTSECTWGNYTVAHRFNMGDTRGNFFAVKKYYENEYGSEKYDASQSGFLYIDASDLPGKIASIDFSGMPCKASRLFVSAWMSSPDRDNESPANVVFSIQGFKNGKATTLYSYCPGSILGDARDAHGTKLTTKTNGDIGIWQQVYFSFVNKNADDFDSFRLTIDNACTNTSGGDILIDDVEVFSVKPEVQIERTIPVCGDQLTLCKMTVDYDQVRTQLGLNTGEVMKDNPKVWYCLLDKEMFDAELGFDTGTSEGQERLYRMSDAEVKPAFVKALLGDPNSQASGEGIFRSVEFKTKFDDLPEFIYREAVAATVGMASREVTSAGVRHFIISDKVKEPRIKPNHDYYFLFVPRFSDDPVTLANAFQSFEINTRCSVRCKFRTQSPIRVVTDADDEAAVEHETQTCAGKSVSLSVKQVGENLDGDIGERIVQYDWWRDYVGGAFTDVCINVDNATWRVLGKNESRLSNEISLREALLAFRHFYPKATTVAGAAPKNDEGYTLEQSVIDVLHQFTLNTADKVASLVLLNNTCNIYVPAATKQGKILKVTVVPIDHEDTSGTQYCYDPEQVGIKVSGEAPQLFDGLHGYKYPAKLTNVPVRSSLAAVAEVRARADGSAANVLHVPLRGIDTVTDGAIGLTSVSPDVFLAGTNDSTMMAYETKAAEERAGISVQNFRIVGQLKTLEARTEDREHAHADIVFNSDFQPREGYVYTLRFNYRELFNAGSTTQSKVCDGNVLVDLIIVPKYQKWTGAAGNTDWTNDANWQRADLADLHFKADTETDYATNANNGTAQGYVPMLHTSVIVTPDKAGPQLYETNSADGQFLNFVDHEDELRTATPDIEYALLAAPKAEEGVNLCDIYKPYQSKDLVVQSGGELLHAERLDYKKAWVEYALTPDRWYTLGSPLRQSYAGEWYAPNNDACQATPYFRDVTYNATDYHRFAPAVYQRSWDKANPKLYYLDPYSANNPQEAKVDTTTENIYQAANWSAVYNDVLEAYSQGGFSVKVNGGGIGTQKYTKSLFRLPKEDTFYDYYTETNKTDGKHYTVDRTYHHKLATDQLKTGTELTVTLTNENANNRFFLVGNPFACALDLNEFFTQNADQLNGAKYWVLTAGGQEGAMRQPNAGEWISVNGTTEAALASLPSGQGFFVEGKEGKNAITLKFTANMQTSLHTSGTLLRAPAIRRAEAPMLRIRASRSGQASEALVVKDTTAVNGYEAAEDMQLLLDNSLQEIPMVYTLAGNRTSTINRRRSLWRVPLGVLSNSEDPVQLTFSGMRSFGETLSLLDSQTGAVTPLRGNGNADSVKVEVPGVTTGRYFILSSERPTLEEEQNFTQPLIQADNGSVTISSSAAHVLTYVRIVAADGRTVYKLTPYVSRLSLKLPTGVYVVEARTDEGESVAKVSL